MKSSINRRINYFLVLLMLTSAFSSASFSLNVFAQSEIQKLSKAKNGKSLELQDFSLDNVTFETTDDYVHNIYANGMPLIVEACESNVSYSKLYVDLNGNGVGDDIEEITDFKGDGTINGGGIYYSDIYGGYFLHNSSVYGGAKDGAEEYDTKLSIVGKSEGESSNCTVNLVFGGNADGTLAGNTCVNIYGGNINWLFGGGRAGTINGNTEVNITGGRIIKNIYGGSCFGNINGNTNVEVSSEVASVFGGNENYGKICGDTNIIFADGAKVNGWVYGGGAGYNNSIITEIEGSTNITVNGGIFYHNIYGGGAWRGSRAINSNIVINNGDISESTVYGGGEESSEVTGKADIVINGGSVYMVCATGAGFNGTDAVVENAQIHLNGGVVNNFYALSPESSQSVLNGDLTLDIKGETLSNTFIFLGHSENHSSIKNVSILVQNVKVSYINLKSPVDESLSVTFDNADCKDFYIAEDVLANTKQSSMLYNNCGSSDKKWGSYDALQNFSGLTGAENPVMSCNSWNNNSFNNITIRDSYVNFVDCSTWNNDKGLRSCTDKLILDGGALRVVGLQKSYMPDTVFNNNPLLIRTSSKEAISFDHVEIQGKARLQWYSVKGEPLSEVCGAGIVETEDEVSAEVFCAAQEGYGLKNDSISIFNSDNVLLWRGKTWIIDSEENICTCALYTSTLSKLFYLLPEGDSEAEFVLQDAAVSDPNYVNSCEMVEHKGTVPTVRFSVIDEDTTAENARIEGDKLRVSSCGKVAVKVDRKLNGIEHSYSQIVSIIKAPTNERYQFVEGETKDLIFDFSGADAYYFRVFNSTESQRVEITDLCTSKEGDNTYQFCLPKSYIESLGLGEYKFHSELWLRDGGIYVYDFYINIHLPKEVTNPAVEILADELHYDGKEKTPEIIVRDGDIVISSDEYSVKYENNINTGTASIIITDMPGGRYIVNGKAEFEIVNNYNPVNGKDYVATAMNKNGWINSDFVINAQNGYQLSTGNTLEDTWVQSLKKTEDIDDGSVTFYVKNMVTGEISLAVTEKYKIDCNSPENFDINFNGKSVLRAIDAPCTEILFCDAVDVTVSADDTLSGVDSIKYYKSENVLSKEEVSTIDNWTDGNSLCLLPLDDKSYIIYVKVTDKAGNSIYFSTNAAEFDISAPVISGIKEGSTYYTTQFVTVEDKNLAEVTVDGKLVTGDVIITGNVDKNYVIKAVDSAGNESIVTVIMKPISSIQSLIDGITEENVKASDKEVIESVMPDGLDQFATEEEKAALKLIEEKVNILFEKIEKVTSAVNSEIIRSVENITEDNVKISDRLSLEAAKSELKKALIDYANNYTDEEIQTIENSINRITKALEKLDEIPYEPVKYNIIEGDGSVWEYGQEKMLVFKANGEADRVTGIEIDGKLLASDCYIIERGSTVIKIKEIYLNSLSVGKHKLIIHYIDGDADAEFEIKRGPEHSKQPQESSKPEESKKPDETGRPIETGKPDETLRPEESKRPDQTNKPKESSKPQVTNASEALNKPETSITPGLSADLGSDDTNDSSAQNTNALFNKHDITSKSAANNIKNSPKTGDESNMLFWVSVMICSAVGLSGMMYSIIKNDKQSVK